MHYVASGENSNYPLNTTHFLLSQSPSDPIRSDAAAPTYVNGTVADDPGVGTSTLSHVTIHVTQKTRKCSRRASAETKKETQSESLSLLHRADTVEKHITRPR